MYATQKARASTCATVLAGAWCDVTFSLVTAMYKRQYLTTRSPPYSPNYNPIEQAFSVIKALLHRNGIAFYQSKALYYEMYRAYDTITPEMTWGFFAHSGYVV
jgi:hypothetical protein